jgi:hypothetical protein
MKSFVIFPLLTAGIALCGSAQAQDPKFDTTVKSGRVGYRIYCNNKNGEENRLDIKLIGFQNSTRDPSFFIQGRVTKAELDDLNNDGYPDLLLYIYSGMDGVFGTVYAFVSDQNKAVIPLSLPDVMGDGKLNSGYKGHDEFSMMEGSLIQKFPIYKPGDDKDKPTGGKRVIQYQMVPAGDGKFKFKAVTSYDLK